MDRSRRSISGGFKLTRSEGSKDERGVVHCCVIWKGAVVHCFWVGWGRAEIKVGQGCGGVDSKENDEGGEGTGWRKECVDRSERFDFFFFC